MAAPDCYRRGDGAHLSAVDLTQCVPVHPTELDQWVWPIELVEDWLLHASHDTLAELAQFLGGTHWGTTPADVTEQLGLSAIMLHRLIRAASNET